MDKEDSSFKYKKNEGQNNVLKGLLGSPLIYLSFIILLTIFLCSKENENIALAYIILFASMIYTIYLFIIRIRRRMFNITELALGFSKVFGKSMKNMDLPILYISNQGKIIWENNISANLGVKEFLIEINKEIAKKNKNKEYILEIAKHSFLIHYTELIIGNDVGNLVFLVDKTEEKMLAQTLEDTKTVLGIITIDSFEEVMQGLEDLDRFNTMAGIDKEIVEWISKYSGVVSKIDKDKYVYIIEKKHIKDLESNSFEILEKMNKISEKIVKVPVTISIGLSYDDETLYSRYKSATTALEIAMGRGGNQAVIKNNKGFDIYGDSDLQIDKTNRVRARTIAQALKDIIEKSESVYIMGHKNTDIDCIGAAVGIFKIAKTFGKDAKIIVDTKYNHTTKTIIEKLKKDEDYEEAFIQKDLVKKLNFEDSVLIVVDTHKESYLAVPEILEEFSKVVVIDHHRRGAEFIENTIINYHEVYASSTSELVTEILMHLDEVKLSVVEAESLFSGIIIDTKNFTFKTGVRTFETAAYLKKTGLDITEIKHLFQNDFETYMAKVDIVKNAEIIDNQIALSICETEHDNLSVIAAQAADELLSITGILASFVLCKIDGVIMISGRSLGDINVQLILEKLGGGGHLTFAGAQIAGITIEEAKEKLLEIIKDYSKKVE